MENRFIDYSFENNEIEKYLFDKIYNFNSLLNKLEKFMKKKEDKFSIFFVTDETIKKLNKTYREKAEVTDVLSFSFDLNEELNFNFTENLNENLDKDLNKDLNKNFYGSLKIKGGEYYLGEIIFAPNYFINKALKLNENIEEYFLYMILHSYLHLKGYEHRNEEEYSMFEDKTENLLKEVLNEE